MWDARVEGGTCLQDGGVGVDFRLGHVVRLGIVKDAQDVGFELVELDVCLAVQFVLEGSSMWTAL